jgi:hypothetical protein
MRRRSAFKRRSGIALVALTIAITALRVAAQGSYSSDRPVSPTVVASWLTRGDKLTLLVLWRGTPGWFFRGNGNGSGGGGNLRQEFHQIRYGETTLRIEYDFDKETATIARRELSLREINVVMVDFVDSVNGPTVVDTRYVDPAVTDTFNASLVVVGREPDLYPYLQCNLSLPGRPGPIGQMEQSLISMVCDQLRPR